MTQSATMGPGRLVLVVGPSGVGVDTMIDTARDALNGDERFRFVTRTITRPANAGGEEHQPISVPDFERAAQDGAFALHWRAHGLHYGIPSDIDADIAAGRTVVANVSRTVINAARARYRNLAVASITASRETLARRLAHRNRESADEILRRLDRATANVPQGSDVHTVDNDGPLEVAAARFLQVLRGV